ncbi:MAG: response regulator [Deltaproteobacteria bacterium]|nr:response regulator [Deltaproteobacteria bacterium]
MGAIKAKILVIDDEKVVQEGCTRILTGDGYDVETSYTGQEGFKKMEEETYDLVIADLKMPGISGMEVLKKIKKNDPDISVIMITGYPTPETAVEAMKLGAFDYLPKPFTPAELISVVNKAIEEKKVLIETKHLESAYQDATKAISSSLNLNEVLELIVRSVVNLLKTKGCGVNLLDDTRKKLETRVAFGLSENYLAKYPEEAKKEGIVSILSIPLKAKEKVIGVLRVYTGESRQFTDKEMDLVNKLAEQAGIAVVNAKLYKDIKDDYDSLKKKLPPPLKNRLSKK